MVLLFVFCALLPITALAIISFSHVSKQLNEQSEKRLHQASKFVGMDIYERLLFLEAEMGVIAFNFSKGHSTKGEVRNQGLRGNLEQRFKGLTLNTGGGSHVPLLGVIPNPREPTLDERRHIISGRTLLSTLSRAGLPARIFMSRALDPQQPSRGTLVGEIDTNYLWGIGEHYTLPPMTGLCVLDQSNNILICSHDGSESFPGQLKSETMRSPSRQFDWMYNGKEYLASSRAIPLKFNYFVPYWTIVVSELKTDVFAPMADFKRIFPFVVLLSLLVVLLLSIRQIRRSLVPLERLKAGTQRIAKRDFASRVNVTSGDEFEELAESFNTMASQLGRQFETLATMAEIDRAILSALDTEKIVETVLARLRDVFPSDYVSVTLFDGNGKDRARTYLSEGIPNRATQIEDVQLHPDEVQPLFDHSDGVCIADGRIPAALARFARPGIQSLLVLPIFLKQGLAGIVALGHFRPASYSQDDMVQARQLADQVAVALSNAYYIVEHKRAKKELQNNLQRLVALRDIYLAVTSTLDLDTILDFLLRKIDLLLPHSATTVWLMNKNGGGPIPVAHRNFDSDDCDTEEFEAWGGVPSAVFETKATVYIKNLHKAPRLQDQEFFHKNGLVTYLGVPLVANGDFLGALSVYMKEEHAFSNEEVDFYSTLAGQVAIAIYNSRLYEEMKDQADSLARANRVKNEFLSVMSHELRTPLTIIISFTESMREGMFGKLTKKQSDTLRKVAQQSSHLLTMITTLMETTGLEAEVIKVEIETFSLGELLEEIRSTYDFPLNNGLALEWDTPTEPIIMKTDQRRIKLILQHLIDNAIKFTEQGQVTIAVRLVPTKETLEFKVMDTGIGIPTEALPVIFDKLVQWDSSETRCYGGVGLGLYVVKAFSELLGGRVEVESQPGEGSTFTVNLPVDYHGAKGAGASSKGEGNGLLKSGSTGRQISAPV